MKRRKPLVAAYLIFLPASARATETILDFDSVEAALGSVDATEYLAGFGITIGERSPAETSVVIIETEFWASPPNVMTSTTPAVSAHNYTLHFSEPLDSVGFTRPGLPNGLTGIVYAEWSAEAYDGSDNPLGSDGEDYARYFVGTGDLPPKTITLEGPSIAYVRFFSDPNDPSGMGPPACCNLSVDHLVLLTPDTPDSGAPDLGPNGGHSFYDSPSCDCRIGLPTPPSPVALLLALLIPLARGSRRKRTAPEPGATGDCGTASARS